MNRSICFLWTYFVLLTVSGCGGGGGGGGSAGGSANPGSGTTTTSTPVVTTVTPPVAEAPSEAPFVPVEICSSAAKAPVYLGDPFWAVLSAPAGFVSSTPVVTVEQPNAFAASLSCI